MQINLANLLITPIVSAIVGLAVWYFQSRIEAIRRAQERLHDDRRKVYADILDPYIRLFAGIKDTRQTQKVIQKITSYEYKKTAFEFSLIGSDNVVKAFNDMVQFIYDVEASSKESPDPKKMLKMWGSFLLEIRRNVGDPRTGLDHKDMLRGLIKGVDDLFEES